MRNKIEMLLELDRMISEIEEPSEWGAGMDTDGNLFHYPVNEKAYLEDKHNRLHAMLMDDELEELFAEEKKGGY